MLKLAIVVALILVNTAAHAATANFTGRMELVTTTTGVSAWRCQYQYNGQYFWQIFRDNCPPMIEVY
jgi:hypothetical protein